MINRRLALASLIAAICVSPAAAFGQAKPKPEKDIAGSKDHPLLQRFEGSYISYYLKKAFDEHKIALERVTFDYDAGKLNPVKTETAEGARTTFVYVLPKDVSTLEAVRAYEEEFRSRGEVEILFQGSHREQQLDDGYDRFIEAIYKETGQPPNGFMRSNKDARYLAAKLTRPEGDVYLAVYAASNEADSSPDLVPKDRTGVRVDVIETKPRAQRMVTVTADEMSSSLSKAGRVALYGILFDTNKTDLKPESTAALEEIAKLLAQDASLKLIVTGHTDNVGSLESNRDLSQRRAAAVVAALVGKYKIAGNRLQPFGASFAAPVAPNSTEEGRVKNRRVELVPF